MDDRVTQMREARESGKTLGEIAEMFGVSRERVRQVLTHTYGTTTFGKTPMERRREGQSEAMIAYRQEVLEALRHDPSAMSARDIVKNAPYRVGSVAEVLGEYAWMAIPSESDGGQDTVSDEQMFADLHTVWKRSPNYPKPLSRKVYDQLRDKTMLSGGRIGQRMRWSDACRSAGIPVTTPTRREYSRISMDEALEWVTAYVLEAAANSERATARGYDLWVSEHAGAPSMCTVRNIDGTPWRDILASAIHRASSGKTPSPKPMTKAETKYPVKQWVEEHEKTGKSLRKIAVEYGVSASVVRYHVLRQAS